jgi:hypothetical protein
MFGLPELLFDGVYYLTPEHARPWRAADTKFSNSPVAQTLQAAQNLMLRWDSFDSFNVLKRRTSQLIELPAPSFEFF